jgi:hypothetical protein
LSRALPSDAKCCQIQARGDAIAIRSPFTISRRIRLLVFQNRVIDVVTAAIAAEGEFDMITADNENTTIQAASPATQEPKAATKATAAPRRPRVAPSKAKSGKKATPAKKADKPAKPVKKAGKAKPAGAREGSKTEKVLELLRRPDGATLKEIMKATGWQPHSVRGFLSGTIGKKMGLTVNSTKGEGGERSYSLKG